MEITAHDAFKLGGYYERLQAMEHDARFILHKYGYGNIGDLKLAITTCLEDATYTTAPEKKPREPKGKTRAKAPTDPPTEPVTNGQPDQPDDPYPNVEAAP